VYGALLRERGRRRGKPEKSRRVARKARGSGPQRSLRSAVDSTCARRLAARSTEAPILR
jgi:hypothetical protein